MAKEPDFLQTDGTDHVYDNTVSSVSWSFPGLEFASSDRFLEARVQGVLAVKGCREKVVCQDVHMSLSGCFASDVMSGSDTARDTWQDGEGRECRFVSIDKEIKQNAVNFKRDFLLHAAEEILRFKVNEQVQARVGGRQEMDGGRKPQEKSIANSKREKSIANSRHEERTYSW